MRNARDLTQPNFLMHSGIKLYPSAQSSLENTPRTSRKNTSPDPFCLTNRSYRMSENNKLTEMNETSDQILETIDRMHDTLVRHEGWREGFAARDRITRENKGSTFCSPTWFYWTSITVALLYGAALTFLLTR